MPAMDESAPLLREQDTNTSVDANERSTKHSHIKHWSWKPPCLDPSSGSARTQIQRFQSSRFGHYAVLLLVALDVSCIFADFLITIFQCERECKHGSKPNGDLEKAQDALGIVSLVFSCLFMVELLLSIWAFGFEFFKSKFHCFDAAVILAGFIVDVCLKGVLEEVGSIVVVLRLWRVFKIIEEFSAGAEEQMDTLNEHIEKLVRENKELKKRIAAMKGTDE